MKHDIKLIRTSVEISKHEKYRLSKVFVATIDGTEIRGVVRYLEGQHSSGLGHYRLHIQGQKATKHPDYKEIRKQILIKVLGRFEP